LLAVFFVVLLGMIGLAIDLGRIFVAMGSLRRAVDAASLGAASQFREGRGIDEMTATATQIMNMNGIDPSSIIVEDCPHAVIPGDAVLCVMPHHKYVRVTVGAAVPMTFLRVININQIPISSSAISEAASLDVVLVIDISESMAQTDDGKQADPSECNPSHTCQPFEKVRSAANTFVDRILDLPVDQESDRIAIVYFSNGWQSDPSKFPHGASHGATDVISPGWITNNATAHTAVNNLNVYQSPKCDANPLYGTCLAYSDYSDPDTFQGINCPIFDNGTDPSSCTTTNIGGGLRLGGNMFATESRPEALWVVILLTDGAANASNASLGHLFGYCPDSDWSPPFCRDRSASDYLLPPAAHSTHITQDYDANDYARDSADFVGCYQKNMADACKYLPKGGQGALIFTIGLGSQVVQTYSPDPIPHGVALLRYAAAVGDDGDPATDPCTPYYGNMTGWQTNCGNYYFDATGDKLISVFEDIASRIFTRITR
jgi:hypothetical protein